MRSAPNFGDLLLDRRPSHFVPPEMRDCPAAVGARRRIRARGIFHRALRGRGGALLDTVVLGHHVAGGRATPPPVRTSRELQGVVSGDNHRRVVTA